MTPPNRVFTSLFLWLAGMSGAQAQGLLDRDGWSPGWGYGHMMFGGVMMFAFWGGLIVLLVLLVRWLGSNGGPHDRHHHRPDALHILQERFARGEIDEAEFEARRCVLDRSGR